MAHILVNMFITGQLYPFARIFTYFNYLSRNGGSTTTRDLSACFSSPEVWPYRPLKRNFETTIGPCASRVSHTTRNDNGSYASPRRSIVRIPEKETYARKFVATRDKFTRNRVNRRREFLASFVSKFVNFSFVRKKMTILCIIFNFIVYNFIINKFKIQITQSGLNYVLFDHFWIL